MEYKLNPAPGSTLAPYDWVNDPFYKTAIVLGIDIGIEGIGIWLRKGRNHVYARTFLFNTPEAAPLKGRRLLRGGRRCRQSEQHREVLLKQFCAEFDLPWTEIKDEENEDGPFKLRLRAVRSKLASKEALVVCLRHIIKHRGYDYHETDGDSFPWGDELKADVATAWAKAAYCSQTDADEFLHTVSDCGWNEKQLMSFRNALNAAIERHKQGIEAALEKHFAQGKNNLRIPARKHNFPRSLIWEHMEKICGNHPDLFGGETRLSAALIKLKPILYYHRKKPGALAERKVNRCPVAIHLFGGAAPKCDSNSNPHIRRFKLLEFLATRSFVSKAGTRLLANADLMKWLLDEVLAEDICAVEANKVKGGQKQERRKFGCFREEFTNKFDSKDETELASDRVSHNKDFFEQLGDLLRPKISVLNARASLCGKSAEGLFKHAIKDGYQAEMISRNLKEKQFDGHSFYTLRQAAAAGFGTYPQVEFLLGRRRKNAKSNEEPAVPGKLHRIFMLPEVLAKLDGKKTPDYVIIETVGDMPRNLDQAKEIQDEQKRRRKFKDELFEKFGIHDQQQDSEVRKRVLLYDQQGGSRDEAICPYTGDSLGDDPLSRKLQIDHIFPESRGGISEMVNLVLTHETTNNKRKGNQTPSEAFGGKQNSAEWQALVARVQKMGWNKRKRELVLRQESSCPEWDNMTRMAQLARQLREEAARWLGVFGDDAKVRQKIGTPTGYQTSVCRASWNENLPNKNRSNLRHHLWDAAVISHIPPGKGMQLSHCGGVFFHAGEKKSGNIIMRALPGLGPDLNSFENATKDQCLVEERRAIRSKKQRYDQTIYSLPDNEGCMWARDPLDKLAMKKSQNEEGLLRLLRDAGIDEKQLPSSRFVEWWNGVQAQWFTQSDAKALFETLEIPSPKIISEDAFNKWWGNFEKKKINYKSLRLLLKDSRITPVEVSDLRLQNALAGHSEPGSLTCKDGTPILGVSGTAKQMTPMAVIPHRNHKGETIGFKLAKESFVRAEIWVAEKTTRDGRVELEYHRRLIPHPRGLANLRQRVLKSTGQQLTWERRLTDEELRELGLVKELQALIREREKISAIHAKAIQKWQNDQEKQTKANTIGLASVQSVQPIKPQTPWRSLRSIYTKLPPHAKRLTDANGKDISRFAKGDLLRVPLTQDTKICTPEQAPYRKLWYRITAINASGQVEMQLAERKQVKPFSEKDRKEGKQLSADEEWLCKAFQKQPGSDEVMAFLLRLTRSNDQPPDSAK
ncbi:MAG: hypothetical protein JWQ71_3222 [Pedosphaera sp.]|nr:hypothetical protein [Pedosphaera sp.]